MPATIAIILVALLHIYFLILEMFLWEKPVGLKTFSNNRESAAITKTLAANMGLYNGFLAAGLIWGASLGSHGTSIQLFFLSCVVIAGIFGGITANRNILLVQALPALISITLVIFK